jgi:hypothetical protein
MVLSRFYICHMIHRVAVAWSSEELRDSQVLSRGAAESFSARLIGACSSTTMAVYIFEHVLSHGPWSHEVPTSIGTRSTTAMTVYIFEHAPMKVGTQ